MRECGNENGPEETLMKRLAVIAASLVLTFTFSHAHAQVPPSHTEIAGYTGLHAAAHSGDVAAIKKLTAEGAPLESRDSHGRTPLHVAVFASHEDAVRALAEAGADMNALEHDDYDAVTIAAVADDVEMLKTVLAQGGSAANITSPYEGTALIAAAHLGHDEVVRMLIKAGAPLDHVNNLGWTALIESVILGDAGPRHVETARALIAAGADVNISDRQGTTPLAHARQRGYDAMAALFPKS
jgi:ankyrin repeat protein